MKSALILVLVSALMAPRLLADIVTLRSGQTYSGEIVKQTTEYLDLRTESETLRIEMFSIAQIETKKGVYLVKPRFRYPPELVAAAEAAADADFDRYRWFGTGCVLGIIGVIVASATSPSPPQSQLVGKPPEYVAAYQEIFKGRSKRNQTRAAVLGCPIGTTLHAAIGCIYVGNKIREDIPF